MDLFFFTFSFDKTGFYVWFYCHAQCKKNPHPRPPLQKKSSLAPSKRINMYCMAWKADIWVWKNIHGAGMKARKSFFYVLKVGLTSQSTYIHRIQSSVWRLPNYWLPVPTPSPPSECVLPPHQRRWGTHSPGGEGVGGSLFRKMSDIGLASYSIIPLLTTFTVQYLEYALVFISVLRESTYSWCQMEWSKSLVDQGITLLKLQYYCFVFFLNQKILISIQ